jgi:predicted amidophosphoribosyltransferase
MGLCTACFGRHDLTWLGGNHHGPEARSLDVAGLHWRGLRICGYCRDELDELRLPPRSRAPGSGVPGSTSLYRYEGLVRHLVLRAKVHGDRAALAFLVTLVVFGRAKAVAAAASWADAVIPAPSSLWGRLRGRLDLAYHMAAAVAALGGRPLLSAPFLLHWRLRKQALQQRSSRRLSRSAAQNAAPTAAPNAARWNVFPPQRLQRWSDHRFDLALAAIALHPTSSPDVAESAIPPDLPALLLIDDVVTTGATLRRLSAAVAPSAPRRVRALTFAART